MEYDRGDKIQSVQNQKENCLYNHNRGDSFFLDFEPNGNSFGSKSKGKLSHHDRIP